MENKSKFLSGPHLEKSRDVGHVQQASMDRTGTKLGPGCAPARPWRPLPESSWRGNRGCFGGRSKTGLCDLNFTLAFKILGIPIIEESTET